MVKGDTSTSMDERKITSAEEERVCDPCIHVVDEALAKGLASRLGKTPPHTAPHTVVESDNRVDLTKDRSGRAVLSLGSYR